MGTGGVLLSPAGWRPAHPPPPSVVCVCMRQCLQVALRLLAQEEPQAAWVCVPRAERGAPCVRGCALCHVYPDLARCHSQYSAVKEQCGPLFLSERKNEQLVCLRLVAPQKGWVLLGTHPPACTASRRVQHHTGPLPRPLATCAWGGWPSLLPPCCPVIGPSSSFRKPPSAA